MDIKALRQKILDLAIRGKLVPQDPNDEPASVLLERIRAEKQQMVKDGKLKPKDIKNNTIIFVGEDNLHYEKFQDGTVKCIEDEIPFELPEGWEWCRFTSVTVNRDSERKPISSANRTNVAKIYDYYGASGKIDKIDKFIFNEKLLLIGEDGANLVTRSKPIAFFAEGQYWVNNHAHCIDSTDKLILEYLCLWEWVRLQNCCTKEIRRGKSPKYTEQSNTLVFAQKCNTKYAGIDTGLALYLDESTLSKYSDDEYMQDGDIVVNSTGTGTLGRIGFYRNYDNNVMLPIVPDSHVTVIRACSSIQKFYLYIFMKANQHKLEKQGEGSTNQKELKPLTLKNMLVPIPPYSEQERISAVITSAFSITSAIRRSLS